MCYICVGSNKLFAFPGRTITASQADVNKATSYLHTLGFSGLKFEDHPEDNWIRLTFKDYNPLILDKTFGARKKASMGRVQWVIPNLGAIYVNEKRKRVLIQNIEKVEKRSPSKPLAPVDVPPYNPNIDNKTFADPKTVELYKRVQATGSRAAYLDFMKKVWEYWNTHKFKGDMKLPDLGFLKDTGLSMRTRGLWRHGGMPPRRELLITPRLFNARFDVFAETFLHEMCHQAVSEINKVRETSNKGHGPLWASWMRKVGLEPNRYDKNDNIEYMTPEERAEQDAAEDRREDAKEGLVEKRYRPPMSPYDSPVPILYLDSAGKKLNGYLFYNPKAPKMLNFITDEQLQKGSRGAGWGWARITGKPTLYERTVAPIPEYADEIKNLTALITRNLEHNKAKRAVRPTYQWRPY